MEQERAQVHSDRPMASGQRVHHRGKMDLPSKMGNRRPVKMPTVNFNGQTGQMASAQKVPPNAASVEKGHLNVQMDSRANGQMRALMDRMALALEPDKMARQISNRRRTDAALS